ncbi:MAG: hypothetical protein COU33_05305 [Candidatus Magasanikbacteria bacterium CG10_big_fil_rev_8_21_14_0_10_43_6]|uniref:Uncharacterized protein n=1 Tax=Candidatus Magasanikbacteria bacterium CG10_big_fil_rev_8_21_14_0_10_43_6 TaxID=1974650 RepID=A0A2M6VZU0_9BACT|nr:MAG: hypothetical protein COU33_05305 [Candidatus Magasanikbacteria bacterium CG10_big_fil_rev_8_21_14_0_10_43_6]
MMSLIAKIIGVLGLLLIIGGVLHKNKKQTHILFAAGGLGLLLYSISLRDPIFILLQLVFILASLYEWKQHTH